MCDSVTGENCEVDIEAELHAAMQACRDTRTNVDECRLLPATPASEVTKELIISTMIDTQYISPVQDVPPITYIKSIYWTVMTLLTVGYGDLSLP